MIKVSITKNDVLLGEITIDRLDDNEEVSDYSCRYAVQRGGGNLGLHQRVLRGFSRKKGNPLAIVFAALAQLTPNEMELEGDLDQSDVARRQPRVVREIQAWTSSLRDH